MTSWAPDLAGHRLLGAGAGSALLRRDGTFDWWCAPEVDSPPLLWQLLDPDGGAAGFPDLRFADADSAPAGACLRSVLRDAGGRVEVCDALVPVADGLVLVRHLRALDGPPGRSVRHRLVAGGFDAPRVRFTVQGRLARGGPLLVRADGHSPDDAGLDSELVLAVSGAVLAVGVGVSELPADEILLDLVAQANAGEARALAAIRPPRQHPDRARDALAVLRACTGPTGAVVAAPTTSLPEAPDGDRQFDYRYCWLRDASLSTAVAALLGRAADAERYLDFVHRAWHDGDLHQRPVVDVRGGSIPAEREVTGVQGWAGARPVRVGNGAGTQRQDDAPGLLVEAVSVYLQAGGRLDRRTWRLVRRLAEDAARDPHEIRCGNGVWEFPQRRPLVDGDLGRWLVLDRALWIARGWRPWTRRRHWLTARAVVGDRLRGLVDEHGLLPQGYDTPDRPDAAALMAVAFGLFDRDDPRAHRVVDTVLHRLGAGPYVHRYPRETDDGHHGVEGAFLPVSFLAVTALAELGRLEEAERRMRRLDGALPRLLSEEVDPRTDRLLGNVPLVWSHAELARALYVLDAEQRRDRWSTAGLWAWRLQRYLSLRARS